MDQDRLDRGRQLPVRPCERKTLRGGVRDPRYKPHYGIRERPDKLQEESSQIFTQSNLHLPFGYE